jgi:SAM-dependent methyltransferase
MLDTCPPISRTVSFSFLDDAVIDEMAAAEERHWWYQGLRDLLARLLTSKSLAVGPLARDAGARGPGPVVLDAGCGAGANLRMLDELLHPVRLEGFDAHPRAVRRAAEKCPDADVHLGDIRDPTLHHDRYDVVVCCDVVSHVGRNACRAGLGRIAEHLVPGGLFLIHVPACPGLASQHDTAVGTIERYRKAEVESLVRSLGLRIELSTYRMSLLLPAVAAYRRLGRPTPGAPRSDLGRGPALFEPLCRRILTLENRLIARGVRFPLGSSVMVVGRKT